MFIKYCVFSLKFCDFSELCQFCCSAGVLPAGVCTHTDTKGKQGKARVRKILKSSEKNTIFNEHPVAKLILLIHYHICSSPRRFKEEIKLSNLTEYAKDWSLSRQYYTHLYDLSPGLWQWSNGIEIQILVYLYQRVCI